MITGIENLLPSIQIASYTDNLNPIIRPAPFDLGLLKCYIKKLGITLCHINSSALVRVVMYHEAHFATDLCF